jgi:hypothetical protein
VKSVACIIIRRISVAAPQAVVLTPVLILLIQLVFLIKLRMLNPLGFKCPARTLMRMRMLAAVYFREIRQRSNCPYVTTTRNQ